MDPKTLKFGDRIQHPDFGEGVSGCTRPPTAGQPEAIYIEWDRQGPDCWDLTDNRWEQVLLA